MFLYQTVEKGVRIAACRSLDGSVEIPKEIGGRPVTELAPYAFSEGSGKAEGIWWSETGLENDPEEIPYVRGGRLKEISLPPSLQKIGNYAFYNCDHLESICCGSGIADIGSGLFTGCLGVSKLDITVAAGERSCFKELLAELRWRLYVRYRSDEGEARLVFPEFYEEAVENTPARVLSTTVHGCGHRYRYCFNQTEFSFREYDAVFPHVKVQEPEDLVCRLVTGRLRYPLGLSGGAKDIYEEYLKDHLGSAAKAVLREGGVEDLAWLAENYVDSRRELELVMTEAEKQGRVEATSWLMDYRHRRYPVERKRFVL